MSTVNGCSRDRSIVSAPTSRRAELDDPRRGERDHYGDGNIPCMAMMNLTARYGWRFGCA
jgi:hypothetical protein